MLKVFLALLVVAGAALGQPVLHTGFCYTTSTEECFEPETLLAKPSLNVVLPANFLFSSNESRTTSFVVLPEGFKWVSADPIGVLESFVVGESAITMITNGGEWGVQNMEVFGLFNSLTIGEEIVVTVIVNNPNTGNRVLETKEVVARIAGRTNLNVATLNPASNPVQQTFLRLVNLSPVDDVVRIVPYDDNGAKGGVVLAGVPARGAVQLTSQDLEEGNPEKITEGSFGDGEGKWRVQIFANQEITAGVFVRNGQELAAIGGVTEQK